MDPTDERYRKPRRLRNTELQKFVRNASLATTALYGVVMYIGWKRNIAQSKNDERYKIDPEHEILKDPIYIWYRNVCDKITKFWDKEAVLETAKDNIQTDK